METKSQAVKTGFARTMQDLKNLANSDYIRKKRFDDFSLRELRNMKSADLKFLYRKKIREFSDRYLKTVEKFPNEEVFRFEQGEVKNLTQALENFRDQCLKDKLPVREFEEESVEFITDRYKRFFFNSRIAQTLYKVNNAVASTSLGYWGYRAVGALGNTNRFLLKTELLKSIMPIAFFTGVTCKMWAYITKPMPAVSKALEGLSVIAMSPVWLVESLINRVTGPIFRRTPLKTEIPLNVTGEVAGGSGLTWEKLTHTFEFVKNMTQNWET